MARTGSQPLFECRESTCWKRATQLIKSPMSVGISVKGVKPFDGTNFQGWKAQVNALFVMNDVLDVIDGTRTEPAAGAERAAAVKET